MTLNIWLQSDANLKEHPTNNGCDFTNELNMPLDFSSGTWRVAAGEIIYGTSFWQNVRPSFSQIEVEIKNLAVPIIVTEAFYREIKMYHTVPADYVPEPDHPLISPDDGQPRKLVPLFYGKESLRKKRYKLSYDSKQYNVEVYDADKEVSLEQDR